LGFRSFLIPFYKHLNEMGNWNLEMSQKAAESQASGKADESRNPIVYGLMEQGIEKADSKELPHPKGMIIASEMLDQILAG